MHWESVRSCPVNRPAQLDVDLYSMTSADLTANVRGSECALISRAFFINYSLHIKVLEIARILWRECNCVPFNVNFLLLCDEFLSVHN